MVLQVTDDGLVRIGVERERWFTNAGGERFQFGAEIFEEEDEAAHSNPAWSISETVQPGAKAKTSLPERLGEAFPATTLRPGGLISYRTVDPSGTSIRSNVVFVPASAALDVATPLTAMTCENSYGCSNCDTESDEYCLGRTT
jgi:hypothetical protein